MSAGSASSERGINNGLDNHLEAHKANGARFPRAPYFLTACDQDSKVELAAAVAPVALVVLQVLGEEHEHVFLNAEVLVQQVGSSER